MTTFKSINNHLDKLTKIMKEWGDDDFWIVDDKKQMEEALYLAEHITLKMRSLYNQNVTSPSIGSENQTMKITKEVVGIKISQTSIDQIEVIIPLICNKKKFDHYVSETLALQLKEFFGSPLYLKNRTVVFEYEYPKNNAHAKRSNGFRDIDYDNTELRSILNALTKYVLFDDSPKYYNLYCCYRVGAKRQTHIHILAQEEFKLWLERSQYGEKDH